MTLGSGWSVKLFAGLVVALCSAEMTSAGAAVGRGQVEYVQMQEAAYLPFSLHPTAHGLRSIPLSRDPASSASTDLVHAQPMWRWDEPERLSADVELLVVEGELTIAGRTLQRGGYAWIPAGTPLGTVESENGGRFLWMRADQSSGASGRTAPTFADVTRMPWSPLPSYAGRSQSETVSGLAMKLLRQDEKTGAYTAIVRHKPGYFDPRLEAHETWEELMLLEGDYLMGSTGGVTAGTYIFRPGQQPHGPQASRTGAVWLARGERAIDFQLTLPSWATQRVEQYLNAASMPEVSPFFGEWSAEPLP